MNVNYKKCWLALKHQVESLQVILKALTGVLHKDLRVCPGALLVGFVVLYGRAEDNDMPKDPPIGAFKEGQDEGHFSASCLPADYR